MPCVAAAEETLIGAAVVAATVIGAAAAKGIESGAAVAAATVSGFVEAAETIHVVVAVAAETVHAVAVAVEIVIGAVGAAERMFSSGLKVPEKLRGISCQPQGPAWTDWRPSTQAARAHRVAGNYPAPRRSLTERGRLPCCAAAAPSTTGRRPRSDIRSGRLQQIRGRAWSGGQSAPPPQQHRANYTSPPHE